MPLVLPKFHSATQHQKYTFSSECTVRPIFRKRLNMATPVRQHSASIVTLRRSHPQL
jgi:hypothetical protein